MITFIVKGNRARTAPDFLLKDLPGSGGRIDILCRCLTSSLLLSHGIRKDVQVILCLGGEPDPPKCIRVMGDKVKHLSPDERSTAILLMKALESYRKGEEVESTPGIYISGHSFKEILEQYRERIVLLDEGGDELNSMPVEEPCFVLGDHLGFDEDEEKLLSTIKHRMRVSPLVLHGSHCIVLVLNRMDMINERDNKEKKIE